MKKMMIILFGLMVCSSVVFAKLPSCQRLLGDVKSRISLYYNLELPSEIEEMKDFTLTCGKEISGNVKIQSNWPNGIRFPQPGIRMIAQQVKMSLRNEYGDPGFGENIENGVKIGWKGAILYGTYKTTKPFGFTILIVPFDNDIKEI